MAGENVTRACVVCGAMFPRSGKRLLCSEACETARRHQYNAKHKPAPRKCLHCHAEFQPAHGVGTKYCSKAHSDAAKLLRDNARTDRNGPEWKAAKKRWAESAAGREWRKARRKKENADKQARRKLSPRVRAKELEAAKAKRRADRLANGYAEGRRLTATEAQARDVRDAYNAQAALVRAGQRKAAAWIRGWVYKHRPKKPRGQADSTLALKAKPEAYAVALAQWRARGFKKKTGKEMPTDGTVGASVVFAGRCCLYCDCVLDHTNRTIDHMDPLTLGGVHSASNIAPCCHTCNSSKGGKMFMVFVATLRPKDRARAVKFYEKRNGPMEQGSLTLGMVAA